MASTIEQGFRELKQNLEITGLQQSTVSTRQKSVRAVMEAGLNVSDSFLTGSYSRSTMIAPLNEADLDIVFLLDNNYFYHYNNQNGGQAALLDLVKRTLLRTYSKTPDISRNGQAVTIRFSDFSVDVVPGFNRNGGGYLIPNSITQTWISTDPRKHVAISTAANSYHNGNFIPLVKMLKGWNRNIGRYFRSFHLEVMALAVLERVTISDFPSAVRFFFDKARDAVAHKNPDPAGYGGDVGAYVNTPEKILEAVSKLQRAYELAQRAEQSASIYRIPDAFEYWRRLFGDNFPAYG